MNQLAREARALCRDATEGPWMAIDKGNSVPSHAITKVPYAGEPRVNIASGISPKTGNAVFIARSRTLLPEMADEIERLEAELDAANDLISRAAVWLGLHKSGGIYDVLREFKKHLAAMKEAHYEE